MSLCNIPTNSRRSNVEDPDYGAANLQPGQKRCPGRRVHPFDNDYFIQCEREAGHEGWHCQSKRIWNDDNPWAIVNDKCARLVEEGGSVWRIKRAG